IAVSTVISAFNSLTLSPALAALLLKPTTAKKDYFGRLLDLALGWFFWLFNFGFKRATNLYTRAVGGLLRVSLAVLVVYGGLRLMPWMGLRGVPGEVLDPALALLPEKARDEKLGSWDPEHGIPTGYIPNQDKGYLLVSIQLPDATAVEETRRV